MNRPQWTTQLYAYGYLVCLIAVITILFSLVSLIRNTFEFANPEMSEEVNREFGASSLEACRQRYIGRASNSMRLGGAPAASAQLPSDSVLMSLCREERGTRIASVRYQAMKSLVTSALMLLVAVALFAIHWRWLRKARTETA